MLRSGIAVWIIVILAPAAAMAGVAPAEFTRGELAEWLSQSALLGGDPEVSSRGCLDHEGRLIVIVSPRGGVLLLPRVSLVAVRGDDALPPCDPWTLAEPTPYSQVAVPRRRSGWTLFGRFSWKVKVMTVCELPRRGFRCLLPPQL